MDKVFELVYKSGPHGDCCSSYTLKFYGEPTLRDFIQQVLEQRNDEWGIPTVNTTHKNDFPVEKNFNYVHLDCSLLKFRDEWLLRKGTEYTDKLNETVYIASVTDKAVLFTFSGEWENKYH